MGLHALQKPTVFTQSEVIVAHGGIPASIPASASPQIGGPEQSPNVHVSGFVHGSWSSHDDPSGGEYVHAWLSVRDALPHEPSMQTASQHVRVCVPVCGPQLGGIVPRGMHAPKVPQLVAPHEVPSVPPRVHDCISIVPDEAHDPPEH
jgi:hypothetical protein